MSPLRVESGSRFFDRVTGVVLRVVLLVGPIVGDSANDFLWIVTSREGALRIGPVMFGLAERARLRRIWRLRMVAGPEITLDWLGAEPEILEMIDALRVLLRLYLKLGVGLPFQKAREAKHAGRGRSCWIAS